MNGISQTGLDPIIQSAKCESPRCDIVRSRENGDWSRMIDRGHFDFRSGHIFRYSNIGVQHIIFDFKITIYEQISVEETCRIGVSTSWN